MVLHHIKNLWNKNPPVIFRTARSRTRGDQVSARTDLVIDEESRSVFFKKMEGSQNRSISLCTLW